MPYQLVDKLHTRYNTPNGKFSVQLEDDSLNFDRFMTYYQIKDDKECLRYMVKYLNNITPQLVDGFRTKSNKVRYLGDSILRNKWAITPPKNMSTA